MNRSICVMLVCAVATAASAQTKEERPRRARPQTMTLTESIAAAGAGDSEGMAPEAAALSGVHTDSDTMLTYERHLGRATLGVTGRTVLRYDAQNTELTPMSHQATVGFSAGGPQHQFRASQSLRYSPYFQFGAAPAGASPDALDEAALAHSDFANAELAAYTSVSDVGLTQGIGRRSSLSMSFNQRRTIFERSDLDQTSLSGAMTFNHRLSRFVSLRTGYGLTSADYAGPAGAPVRMHNLDLGLDYSRALSLNRKTMFGFKSGSVLTRVDRGMAFVLAGDATLTRSIGRTWSARLLVKRDVQMLDGFRQPVLSNMLSGGFGGSLNRRMAVSSSLAVSSDTVGVVSDTGSNYQNWTASAGWRLTLTRRAMVDVQYFYYGHHFDNDVVLAPGLFNQQTRQGLRVGMTWQMPVLQ